MTRTLIILVTTGLLAACGQTGPLTLPDAAATTVQSQKPKADADKPGTEPATATPAASP